MCVVAIGNVQLKPGAGICIDLINDDAMISSTTFQASVRSSSTADPGIKRVNMTLTFIVLPGTYQKPLGPGSTRAWRFSTLWPSRSGLPSLGLSVLGLLTFRTLGVGQARRDAATL